MTIQLRRLVSKNPNKMKQDFYLKKKLVIEHYNIIHYGDVTHKLTCKHLYWLKCIIGC